jgi:hypothetical protein
MKNLKVGCMDSKRLKADYCGITVNTVTGPRLVTYNGETVTYNAEDVTHA